MGSGNSCRWVCREIVWVFILLLAFPLASYLASAATIKGTAYDPDLRPMKDVVLEINTTPVQKYVAKDGSFLFSLPIGTYNISATFETQTEVFFATDIITVNDEGRYLRDLFLEPKTKAVPQNQTASDNSFYQVYKPYFFFGGGTILGLLIIWLSYFLITRTKVMEAKKEAGKDAGDVTKDELEKVLGIIRKSGGRATQKDIRKEIPYSEAKISLMISELEEKGRVKKIKKGRGNIIILK
jgi:uncharacterized membrane protein